MIPGLLEKLNDIHKLYLPKIELFYAAHDPDMWMKSMEDFERAYQTGDTDVTLQALTVYKYRREKMLEIYKLYTELTQEPLPKNPVIEAIQKNLYEDKHEQTKRSLISCDECNEAAGKVGAMFLISEERLNEYGDPTQYFRSVCRECHARRKTA